jgi:hypothetical protein
VGVRGLKAQRGQMRTCLHCPRWNREIRGRVCDRERGNQMGFTRATQTYTEGEKVLVRGRFLAEPAVVVDGSGDSVVVAIAPESNRTEDITGFRLWEHRNVEPRTLRRYEW